MNRLSDTKQVGVVSRLRLTFAVLAFIALGTVVLSLQQLDSLRESLGRLLGDSVPTLIQAQKMEKQFADLLRVTSRVSEDLSVEAFDQVSHELVSKSVSLKRTVSDARWPEATEEAKKRTLVALDSLEKNSAEMLPFRAGMLVAQAVLNNIRNDLEEFRRDFHGASDPLLLDSALRLAYMAGGSRVVAGPGYVKQDRVAEYIVRMNATIDTATQLSTVRIDGLDPIQSQRLRFSLRSATRILSKFEPGETRDLLSAMTSRLHSSLYDSGGLLAVLEKYWRNSARFSVGRAAQVKLVDEVSMLAESLAAAATIEIDHAGRSLRHAFTIALATLAATALVSILVIAAVSYFVVERQINRRMSKLTKAVRAIAGGDTVRVVDVQGSDELGEMAQALEVFKENASELKRSNEELEKFAYAASHDLRSPLRAIENLALWTLEDARDILPAESVSNLEKLLSRVKRMSQLQTDLLDYSRAGKAEADLVSVDPTALIDDLSELLDPEKKFEMLVQGDSTPATTFITPLRQIMLNLITNAIKHHDRSVGKLTISITRSAERIVYVVTDDGPGIEPEYHDRIFGLFQTLRPRDEVEGSGLGLSLIQKLVERYGGTVVVASNPAVSRGTSFTFDLPVKERG